MRRRGKYCEAELLEDLGRLAGGEARLEMSARFFPGPAFEGVGAGGEQVRGGAHER